MTMVDEGVAGPAHPTGTHGRHAAEEPAAVVACLVRPGTGLVHLDAPCRCFVGGPSPVFLDGAVPVPRPR